MLLRNICFPDQKTKYAVSSFLLDSNAEAMLAAQKLSETMKERPNEGYQQLAFGFLASRDNKSYLSHNNLGFRLVLIKSISNGKDLRLNPMRVHSRFTKGFRKRLFCLLLCIHQVEHCLAYIRYLVSLC